MMAKTLSERVEAQKAMAKKVKEVTELKAKGCSNVEIAKKMELPESSVRHILSKEG